MAKVTVEDAFYLIDKYYNEAIIHCPYVLKKVTYALIKATEEIERREGEQIRSELCGMLQEVQDGK